MWTFCKGLPKIAAKNKAALLRLYDDEQFNKICKEYSYVILTTKVGHRLKHHASLSRLLTKR